MATTYDESKLKAMKVAELKEVLSSMGQPQSGNKAELIARILEKQSSAGDPKEASPVSAPAQEQPAAPQPTPLPVTQESTPQVAPLEPSKPAEPAKPALDVDAELEKRKARAAKFGIAAPEADVDKKLERAQRFGTGADSVASSGLDKLDQPLSNRRERPGRHNRGKGGRGQRHSATSPEEPSSSKTTSGYAKATDPAELEKQAKRAARFQNGPEESKKQKV